MRRWIRRIWRRTRDLWERAKREHSTPREVGWSVAVGVFSGCTPFIGVHMWIALALATVLRLNRLWAFFGSRVSSNVLFVWIAFAEIELAHRARSGVWAPLAPSQVLDNGRQLFGDWLIGALGVGAALGAVLGLAAYFVARGWRARRLREAKASAGGDAGGGLQGEAPIKQHTPGELPPPSSESPPSAPPAPTS